MKFSIVTPAHNSEKFLRETLDSVIKQKGDFCIEYIVIDNLSTDTTASIVKEYQRFLASGDMAIHCKNVELYLVSERDSGMYDAIRRGFSRATGDVHAWLNSDDLYLPGAFSAVQRVLLNYPQIAWLKGITSYIDQQSTIYAVGDCNLYAREWIKAGFYGPVLHFIQQDSVFWRAALWEESGGVNANLAMAGDYFLWRSFANLEPLYSLKAYLSCFRKTPTQKSADMHAYWVEVGHIDTSLARRARKYLPRIMLLPRPVRGLGYSLLFGRHEHYLVYLQQDSELKLVVGEFPELMEIAS